MRIDDRSKILFERLIGKLMFSTSFVENKFAALNRSQRRNKFGQAANARWTLVYFLRVKKSQSQGNIILTAKKFVISLFVPSITLQSYFIIMTVIFFCKKIVFWPSQFYLCLEITKRESICSRLNFDIHFNFQNIALFQTSFWDIEVHEFLLKIILFNFHFNFNGNFSYYDVGS